MLRDQFSLSCFVVVVSDLIFNICFITVSSNFDSVFYVVTHSFFSIHIDCDDLQNWMLYFVYVLESSRESPPTKALSNKK